MDENGGDGKKNKAEWNKKYTLIAIYSFIVIIASFAAIIVILGVRDFFAAQEYLKFFKILTPVTYGFIFAYLLNPLLMFFQNKIFFKLKKKIKSTLSILATYLAAAVVIALFLLMVVPQVIASVRQLTGTATDWLSPYEEDEEEGGEMAEEIDIANIANSKIGVFLENLGDSIQNYADGLGLKISVGETFVSISDNFLHQMSSYVIAALNGAISVLYSIFSGILNVILGILFSIYLLIGKDKFIAQIKKLLFALLPARFSYKLVGVFRKTNEIFGKFIIGKILDSLIVGVICFVFMSIFNISYAALITVIVTVTNVIPFFGPFIGAIPSLLFLAINDMGEAVWFLVFILVLQQIDGNFIGPKILGPKVGLPAFWVIFSIIVMSGIFGIPGIFFGMPVFAVAYALIKEYAENKLKAKGFPEQTENYIKSPDIAEAIKNSDAEGKSAFFGKMLHKTAEGMMGIFHKKPKNPKDK